MGTPAWFEEIREEAHLSMRDVSRMYGIPYGTWCAWEYGTRKPTEYVCRLVEQMLLHENNELDEAEKQELSEAIESRIAEYESVEPKSASQKEEVERSIEILNSVRRKLIR